MRQKEGLGDFSGSRKPNPQAVSASGFDPGRGDDICVRSYYGPASEGAHFYYGRRGYRLVRHEIVLREPNASP